MIPPKIKEALKANFSPKTTAMDCYAECRIYDPLSSWCCYPYAMIDDENICCLMYSNAMGVESCITTLKELCTMYNEHGESPIIDEEFRRTHVHHLVRRLKNEFGRNNSD